MRSKTYWAGQYLLASSTMFLLLALVDWLLGDSLAATWPATLGWSCAAAAIFVASRYRQAKTASRRPSRGADTSILQDGSIRGLPGGGKLPPGMDMPLQNLQDSA